MDLHHFTFMERNLENEKKLTPVKIMNNTGMNSKNIMNNVNIFNDSVAMNNIYKE